MESDATCKAIVLTAIEKVDYLDIPKPKIEAPTDAVLRVLACGICGSDLHPFHGREGIYIYCYTVQLCRLTSIF